MYDLLEKNMYIRVNIVVSGDMIKNQGNDARTKAMPKNSESELKFGITFIIA